MFQHLLVTPKLTLIVPHMLLHCLFHLGSDYSIALHGNLGDTPSAASGHRSPDIALGRRNDLISALQCSFQFIGFDYSLYLRYIYYAFPTLQMLLDTVYRPCHFLLSSIQSLAYTIAFYT